MLTGKARLIFRTQKRLAALGASKGLQSVGKGVKAKKFTEGQKHLGRFAGKIGQGKAA